MTINGEWKNPALRRCDSKAAYPNWKVAESVAQKISVRTGELLIAYQCFDCNRFHVGHADRCQIIVRQSASKPKKEAERAIVLPEMCPHCGQRIPEGRRRAAENSRTPTVYCSRKCQQHGSRKARRAKREADGRGGCTD
jgi:hypothetical protein